MRARSHGGHTLGLPALKDDEVRTIREYVGEGAYSLGEAARYWKVSKSCIADIMAGRTYKHVRSFAEMEPLKEGELT